MVKRLLRMLYDVLSNFGRPDYDLGNDDKILEADKTLKESKDKREELERRMRLLGIQSTPRGR